MKHPPLSPSLRYALAAAVVIPTALRLSAVLLPWQRTWGFDMLRELNTPAGVLLCLAPLLALLLLHPRFQQTAADGAHRNGHIASLSLLGLLLAASLFRPMETFFYGDGGLLIPQIHLFSLGEEYDVSLLLDMKSAPLGGALLVAAMHGIPTITSLIGAFEPTTAMYPFGLVSFVSLLAVSLYILLRLPRAERLRASLLLCGSAGVLFFFGYAEFYTPLFACVILFLLEGEWTVRKQTSVIPLIVLFALCLSAHFQSLVLAPALIYVVAKRPTSTGIPAVVTRRPFALSMAALGALVVFHFIIGLLLPDNRVLMPWTNVRTAAGTLSYTLFSPWHLADMMNLPLLLAPMAAVLLLSAPLLRKKMARDAEEARSSLNFALLSLLFLAAFVFLANTSLGLARDWDLAAPLGVALLFSALLLSERWHPTAMLITGVASLLFTLPWLVVNLHAPAGSARFERILRLDDTHMYGDYALSGYEALRKYHRRAGDPSREIDLTQRMIELTGYPLHYRELSDAAAVMYREAPEEYERVHIWMLARLLERAQTMRRDGVVRDYAMSMDQIDSLAQGIGVQALTTRAPFPDAQLRDIAAITRGGRAWPGIIGMQAYARKDFPAAVVSISEALASGFASPILSLFHGNALALSGRHVEALQALEEGIASFPNDWMLKFTLAKYYLRAGIEHERAVELLRWCSEYGVPENKAEEFRDLLRRLE
ncbi:MAG: hypothetical protein M5R41_01680 [Bacteroidia bacterium]|nr:hypothetical protein [Bacteroidia bacterium]